MGRDVYGPVVAAGAGAEVTATVQGEDLRDRELAYLNALLKQYEYWENHYTPLAGIAKVRAAVEDGPRLNLPMPFVPPGFEKLVERGYGGCSEVQRVVEGGAQRAGDLRRHHDLPNHPAVGPSWFETVAFCRWLTERL